MIVYSLNSKDNPTVPFYIGITNNIQRRFKQHRQQYQRHHPYIKDKDDFFINTICDTGTNEYSTILAEKIETSLIRYYHTLTHGSNRVYDVKEYIGERGICRNTESKMKARLTREMKKHRKFKKIIRIINEDPYRYTVHEIVGMSDYVSESSVNRYTKEYHDHSFKGWLHNYQELWMKYIRNYSV